MEIAREMSVGVHRESSMDAMRFVELLAAPTAKGRWSDKAKGRMVAKTLMQGVTVNKVARRHGLKATLTAIIQGHKQSQIDDLLPCNYTVTV